MISFDRLTAADIECRVAKISERGDGLSLLLYKNARVDMQMLDRFVGPENWQRRHYAIDGTLYCEVSVYDEKKQQWISKSDCGTESNVEKEKGQSSDSFKRACFNWGIGRELYTAPFIWVTADKANIKEFPSNGRKTFKCYDRFSVEKIAYDEAGRISGLAIVNETRHCRAFVWQNKEAAQ